MNVRSKRCSHEGWLKRSTYGLVGTSKVECCAQQAKEGIENVNNKENSHDDY